MEFNEGLTRRKEWASQDQEHLLIFFHVKHYEIYREDKLIHYDVDILN